MPVWRFAASVGVCLAIVTSARPAVAQQPLAPVSAAGRTVSPAFEGWYKNPDGTFSISFGYFNRNSAEALDIPVGAANVITPGDTNQGQPTHFEPRRHWGVFAVRVPADFGKKKVVWTLKLRGETFAIPGSLHPDWQIDALEGEAGSGNTPPALRFEENGRPGQGPAGTTAGPLAAFAGKPITLTVWAADDGKSASNIGGTRTAAPVMLAWFKHQGPGEVAFGQPSAKVEASGGKVTTTATFSAAGDYIVRVRANDSAVEGAGHSQCCWTNGFVRITVTR